MSLQYFGTDGIRGKSGGPLINSTFAYQLGKAVGRQLQQEGHREGQICIGRDPRTSGESLRDSLALGLGEQGFSAIDLGILPTPATALYTLQTEALLGIMLTASHNPASDNGFKFFQANSRKVTPQWESTLESLLQQETLPDPISNPHLPDQHEAAQQAFIDHLPNDQPDLSGLNIALDTACGATCHTTPEVLQRLGATLVQIGEIPDGEQINNQIGSEHPEKMVELVKSGEAEIGIAHDGDGDRVIVCDENGELLTGDEFLGILALHRKSQGTLPSDTLAGTILCNAGLEHSLKQQGISLLRTDVGDRNVTTEMFAKNLTLGGEPSGHYILADQLPTGCGLHAVIKLLHLRQNTGKPLSELRKQITLFPQVTCNLQVLEKPPLESLQDLQKGLQKITDHLEQQGRVLVRYSGTEPKVRLLVEAMETKLAEQTMNALRYLIEKHLPVTNS